jgi:hypothetical protein
MTRCPVLRDLEAAAKCIRASGIFMEHCRGCLSIAPDLVGMSHQTADVGWHDRALRPFASNGRSPEPELEHQGT